MKLTDIPALKLQQTHFFIAKDKVEKACKELKLENYTINADLTVDVDGNAKLSKSNFPKLPIKFNKVSGRFSIPYSLQLTSLEGTPKYVGESFTCYNCENLISLEHCPSYIGEDLNIQNCPIKSLHNIHKTIKEIGGDFICSYVPTHILGLCFVKGLQAIRSPFDKEIITIINQYLHDVHMCQEALIDAGFSEYAKL